MSTMKDLARIVADRHDMEIQESEQFVSNMFDVIIQTLTADDQVKVKGLGTFKIQTVRERASININTGEKVIINSHDRITFTPDTAMRNSVNKPFAHFETVPLNDGVVFDDIIEEQETSTEQSISETRKEYHATGVSTGEDISTTAYEQHNTPAVQQDSEVKDTEESGITTDIVDNNTQENAASLMTEETEEDEENATDAVHATHFDYTDNAEGTLHIEPVQSKDNNEAIGNSSLTDKLAASEKATEENQQNTGMQESDEEPPVIVAGIAELPSDEPSETVTGVTEQPVDEPSETVAGIAEMPADETQKNCKQDAEEEELHPEDPQEVPEEGAKASIQKSNKAEQNNEDMTDQRDHNNDPSRNSNNMSTAMSIFIGLLLLIVGFVIGRATADITFDDIKNMLNLSSKPISETVVYEKIDTPTDTISAVTQKDTADVKDSTVKQNEENKIADNATATEETNATAKEKAEKSTQEGEKKTAETKKPAAESIPAGKYDSDPRIRTGAYDIVGVREVITVQKGQTFASISKAHLGPGMECYLEALNGKGEVRVGQNIKIPQLKLKKAKK